MNSGVMPGNAVTCDGYAIQDPNGPGVGRLAVGGPDHEDGAHHRGPTEQHTDLLFAVDSQG